jgi:hypothetical protein
VNPFLVLKALEIFPKCVKTDSEQNISVQLAARFSCHSKFRQPDLVDGWFFSLHSLDHRLRGQNWLVWCT